MLSDLFGLDPTIKTGGQIRSEITGFELKVMSGVADENDIQTMEELKNQIPRSASDDVADALERLHDELT